jgi:hypothetical protein
MYMFKGELTFMLELQNIRSSQWSIFNFSFSKRLITVRELLLNWGISQFLYSFNR